MQCAIVCGHNETRLQVSVHTNNSFPLVKIIFNLICFKRQKGTTYHKSRWVLKNATLWTPLWDVTPCMQFCHISSNLHIPNRNAEKRVTRHNKRYCNQMKIWSSHLLDNLSNCIMNLKKSGDSTGFEPMTSAMPVQCSNQLSNEVTQLRTGQFVGFMFSRKRNVVWEKCNRKCGVLKSNEDMILALAGQFKQLSHEPEIFRWLNGIRTHDLCDAGAVL